MKTTIRPTHRSLPGALLRLLCVLTLALSGLALAGQVRAAPGDLLSKIPAVNENTLNNAACGVAAATMVLDYYLPQSGPFQKSLDITAVAKYVKQYAALGRIKGTTLDQLKDGIEQASTAPELQISTPLTATWRHTDQAGWFGALQGELDHKRPVIVYLADGHTVWPSQSWHYGHFIVVSGYTADQGIIYHDPWDGQMHTASHADFGKAWGTTWGANPPWRYLTIQAGTAAPTNTPIVSTATPVPTTSPLAGNATAGRRCARLVSAPGIGGRAIPDTHQSRAAGVCRAARAFRMMCSSGTTERRRCCSRAVAFSARRCPRHAPCPRRRAVWCAPSAEIAQRPLIGGTECGKRDTEATAP